MGTSWFSGCPNVFSFDSGHTFEEIQSAHTHDREAIKKFFFGWIRAYAVPGCFSSYRYRLFRKNFPSQGYLNRARTIQAVIDILKANKYI
jgi:hypothetical protein